MKLLSYIIHFFKTIKASFSKRSNNSVNKNSKPVFENELDQKKGSKFQEQCYLSENNEFDSSFASNLLKELLLKPASLEAKYKFNFFTTENLYFKDFESLNKTIVRSTANKIDLNKNLIHVLKKEEFKSNLVFFYNVLVKLIGSKITPYLLYELNIENEEKMGEGVLAVAKGEVRDYNFYSFDITFSKKALNIIESEIYESYVSGFYNTYSVFHPFVHEMGHIIDYYARAPLANRENLLVLFNNKKQRFFSNIQSKNMIINNDYRLEQSMTTKTSPNYNYNEPLAAKALKKFVCDKFRSKNFGFPYDDEQSVFFLASLIVGSKYGKVNDKELFAESFSKWLLTKEEDKTYSWEILNEFFMDYFIKWLEPKGKLLE